MTVPSEISSADYATNGATVNFGVPFRFLDNTHLSVTLINNSTGVETPLVLTTNYTVTGARATAGGTVTTVATYAAGYTLSIRRDVPFTQQTDYVENDPFPAESHEDALDKGTMVDQQLAEQLSRAPTLALSAGLTNIPFPPPGELEFIRWNAAGTALETAAGTITPPPPAPVGTGRERLTADRTYFIRTDGNDANTGVVNNAGGAFLTIQKAFNVIADTLDLSSFNITVQVADGTYTGAVSINGPWVGDGTVTLTGNVATPANCIISTTSASCISLTAHARLTVKGFKLQTTTSGNCISVQTGSIIFIGEMNFGACAGLHVDSGNNTYVGFTANYAISGSAVGHWHVGSPGILSCGAVTITLSGTPAFSSYFAGVAEGVITCTNATFSGAATGPRYLAHKHGIIDIGSNAGAETYFPGSVAGSVQTRGSYVGSATTQYMLPIFGAPAYYEIQSRHFNNNTRATKFKVSSELFGGFGWFYADGDACYSSGTTHLSSDVAVAVGSGAVDGCSFTSKALAASNTHIFDISANATDAGRFRRRTSDGSLLLFNRDTTQVGSISVTTTATAYNTSSDRRLKTALSNAPYASDWIYDIADHVVEFEFKNAPGNRVVGAIAQDLINVAPEAVTAGSGPDCNPGDDGFQPWAVDPAKLIWKLLQEVAALRQRVDSLDPGTA